MVRPSGVSNSYSTWAGTMGVSQPLQGWPVPWPAYIFEGLSTGRMAEVHLLADHRRGVWRERHRDLR